MASWPGCFLLIALLPVTARADAPAEVPEAPVVRVRVTHVISDRFPSLADADLDAVLRTAGRMIATGYERDVRFVLTKPARRPAADYFAELRRRIDPYVPPDSFNPFEDQIEDFSPAFLR